MRVDLLLMLAAFFAATFLALRWEPRTPRRPRPSGVIAFAITTSW